MSNKAGLYRKLPVTIEAIQFTDADSAIEIIEWASKSNTEIEYHSSLMDGPYVAHPDPYLLIPTLEGTMSASEGDYIIRGVKGEFYPCKPDIFASTYESVLPGVAAD